MPDEHIRLVHASGECEIDLARRELRVLGSAVPVGGRAFEVIELLARSAGEIVTKDELMGRIWPGAVVTENTLHVHAVAIRKALGPYRSLLKTQSGRGFRLLGDWIVSRHDAVAPPVGVQRMRVDGDTPASNFPATVTRLVGRSTAKARLRDLMSAYRVVTLTGPGGIGKTSLAVKAARGIVGEFADGGWLVELASLSDPALVPAAAAEVLKIRIGHGAITPEAVARAIGDRKLLLVLDNCEHLIGAAATLAETLLTQCPHITIVATSREILRIAGEHVYRVPPLEVPAAGRDEPDHILQHSAVELFIARSTALDADFAPRDDELPSIGAICRRLDGIPLAIEFAAAQVSTVGIQQVAAGLHDRFALLTRGRRTALPRHRTLRAALDWSYELLSEAEQILLRHLAVFSGGFTVAAASAVVDAVVDAGGGDPSSVIEDLTGLVTKSLVALDRDTGPRWYLLETTRAYAFEKLAAHGELDTAARRHALYFHDLFSRSVLETSAGVSAGERTVRVREIDNVRATLDWCFSTGGDTAIGVDLVAGYADWLRVDVATSMVDTTRGARQSLELLTRALDAADALGDLDAQARALVGVITHHSFSAEHDRTCAAAERLLQVAERIGNAALSRTADELMGAALVMVGRPREAQGFQQRFLDADRSMPDQSRWSRIMLVYRGAAYAFLSRALWLRGFIDQARQAAQTSLDELAARDYPFVLCRVLYHGVCRIMSTTGDFAAAEQNIARLIELATRINAPFWQTAGRFLSGKLMIERGDFAQGVAVLNDAFDACRRTGWRMAYPEFRGALATGLAGLGQVNAARVAVEEGLDDALQREHGHDLYLAELLRIKGDILVQCDAVTAAEDSFREALVVARQQEALLWELRAALGLARLLVGQRRRAEAKQILAPVYGRFTEGFAAPDLRAAKAFLDELPG
jgi:predicted ATPase/DNA-binding winged helix-turn-helix (wHTH) protein